MTFDQTEGRMEMANRSTEDLRQLWSPPCARTLTTVVLHGNVPVRVAEETYDAWRALDMVTQHHAYAIQGGDTGGYNCRPIAGSDKYSLHAFGLAVDINWNRNPLRKDNVLVSDMPKEMVRDILAIRTVGGVEVFGWGGNYQTFKDTMHYEILASADELAKGIDWATVIGADDDGDDPSRLPVLQIGDSGPSVRKLQDLLAGEGFDPGPIDGEFGPHTLAAVRAYQDSRQLDVD